MTGQPVVDIVNASGKANAVLVCEHASSHIPPRYNHLGLDEKDYLSHAAWDIGALDVALNLSQLMDAPLVKCEISRLVYDCNRPPQAPDAIPAKSELIEIPGNVGLDPDERNQRAREIHDPFHEALAQAIDCQIGRCQGPVVIITIHSFTPTYFGKIREVDIGLLHDRDASLARFLLPGLQQATAFRVALNQPYSMADGVTYTLAQHAVRRFLASVMIEIRNDLIGDAAGAAEMAQLLAHHLRAAIEYETSKKVGT